MEVYDEGKQIAIGIIVCGIIIAIGSILGLFGAGWFAFEETEYIEYGGDAYTGIQNAAADTANRIAEACGKICFALGMVITSIGSALLKYFKAKAFEISESRRRHDELLTAIKKDDMVDSGSANAEHTESREQVTAKQQYLCSVCRTPITYGAEKCEGCGVSIDWTLCGSSQNK